MRNNNLIKKKKKMFGVGKIFYCLVDQKYIKTVRLGNMFTI